MDKTGINFTSSINDALHGSMDAFDFLYRQSLPTFKKEVMKYTSNPEDIEDILQEAYVKIFSQLDTLQNANSFLAWGRQICAREAINNGKSKQAKKNDYMLMPDTSDDEEGMGMDEVSADTYSTEFNPEARMDAAETKRLMDEMLDDLTENQRLVICMWEEQYTFKEIAKELDMPENTVKSHFNRGKKALEAKVKDLEKKGTKLYGMAPFPFFLWVISRFNQSYTPDVSSELGSSMLKNTVSQLPEGTINTSVSTPDSIKKYGTDEMRQALSQNNETQAITRNAEADQKLASASDDESSMDTASSVNNNTTAQKNAESNAENSVQKDTSTPDGGHTQEKATIPEENATQNLSGSSENNAVKAAAKTAGKFSATKIIVPALAVVILGTAGIIAYRTLNNDQDTEPMNTEALQYDDTGSPDIYQSTTSVYDESEEAAAEIEPDEPEQIEEIDWDTINDNIYGITLDMVSGTELVPTGSYLWDDQASLLCCNPDDDLWLYACVAPETESDPDYAGRHVTVLRRGKQIFVRATEKTVTKDMPLIGDYLYDYPSIYLTDVIDDENGDKEVLILLHDAQTAFYSDHILTEDDYRLSYGEKIGESEDYGELYYTNADLIVIGGDFDNEIVSNWYWHQPFKYSRDILDVSLRPRDVDMTRDEMDEQHMAGEFTFPLGDNLYTIQYTPDSPSGTYFRAIIWSRSLGAQYGNYDFTYDGNNVYLSFPFALEDEYNIVYIGNGSCRLKLYHDYSSANSFNTVSELEDVSFDRVGP